MSRLTGHYVDRTGTPAFDGRFLDPCPFERGVARVSSPRDGRVGLIDPTGRLVLEHRYDFIQRFVDGIATTNLGGWMEDGLVRGGRWGYVAADGTVLVEPQYELALDVGDGRLTVVVDGKSGFLDLRGQVVVAPRFDFALWHAGGLAVVEIDGRQGYVDRDGAVAIEPRFDEATSFEGAIAKVRIDEGWGVIDRAGELVHEAVYERLGAIKDGAMWAVKDGECFVLTAAGEVLGGEGWEEINQVGEDGIWPVKRDDEWRHLRPDGSVIGAGAGFENALGFLGGTARVLADGRWGFVDREGALVIAHRFEDACGFVEERAIVKGEAGWEAIDRSGARIGPGGFDAATSFAGGMARVQQGDRWGYLDRDGGLAIAPRFDWCGDFADDRAPVLAADRAALPVAGARDGVHLLPEGGLGHPLFDGAGPGSHLIAVIGFGAEPTPTEGEHRRKLIQAWERSVHPAGDLYTEDKWVGPASAYFRIENLADPRADLSLLVHELAALRPPVVETLYARWGTPPGAVAMQPNADPRMPHDRYQAVFDDFPSYWACVWDDDPDGPLPATENYFYLRGAIQTRDGGLCLEERHMPLWFADVKLCMGALQGQGETYLAPTDASRRIEAAVTAAIARRWASVWRRPGRDPVVPAPMVRDGSPGVEPIEYQGRAGYAFAFDCGDLLHWFSSPRLRWREPELMEALREAVLEAGLAPVILWQRFQRQIPMLPMGSPTVLVVNLWERA